MNIFQNFSVTSRTSGLTTAEQCQILVRLKELIHLQRGDFLCEVLEYLDFRPNYQNIKLKLQDFWPSEDYYFSYRKSNEVSEEILSKYKKCVPDVQERLL